MIHFNQVSPAPHYLLIILLVALQSAFAPGMGSAQTSPASEKRMMHLKNAMDATMAHERAYHLYHAFDGMDELSLRELLDHPDDGVALRSAWQRVRAKVPFDDSREGVKTNSGDEQRFVGFMEGRIRAPIPRWWLNRFTGMEFRRLDRTQDSPKLKHSPLLVMIPRVRPATARPLFHEVEVLDEEWGVPQNVNLQAKGERVHLTINDQKWLLPEEVTKNAVNKAWITAHMAGDGVLVVPFNIGEATIFYVRAGKVIWKKDIWGEYILGGSSGIRGRWIELVVKGSRVYMFSGEDMALSMECFDLSQRGANVFRFTTSY